MAKHVLLVGWLILTIGMASAQTVFSWIDEKGVIHYTDKPPAPEVRQKKRFMEFEISIDTVSEPVPTQAPELYQPTADLDKVFSLHQDLSPSCRWIAKRIALLEALMEQHASDYDQILKLEVNKRQQDWLEQGCFASFR
ncbi:DUF4124 domain-containing protein [Motilimonas eburnea]|uniref:DUF4124 domain-containing protein n=1 Tax=Motilimonas eburnea TaxID=1737488 RepID=UPI001E3E4FC0|nr:DUF4124 domain-containing protein [Motilimonas eburnea]MCE2570824.1 DUF4124 domain-containing protein [Motilimonas eburnea]